jgi:hypothetical protein
MKSNILKKGEIVSSWPGKDNAYKCEMLNSDNSHYQADVPKAECELVMYIKLLASKLTQREVTKLEKLIDEFGDERYYEAETNASMHEAGEDI